MDRYGALEILLMCHRFWHNLIKQSNTVNQVKLCVYTYHNYQTCNICNLCCLCRYYRSHPLERRCSNKDTLYCWCTSPHQSHLYRKRMQLLYRNICLHIVWLSLLCSLCQLHHMTSCRQPMSSIRLINDQRHAYGSLLSNMMVTYHGL